MYVSFRQAPMYRPSLGVGSVALETQHHPGTPPAPATLASIRRETEACRSVASRANGVHAIKDWPFSLRPPGGLCFLTSGPRDFWANPFCCNTPHPRPFRERKRALRPPVDAFDNALLLNGCRYPRGLGVRPSAATLAALSTFATPPKAKRPPSSEACQARKVKRDSFGLDPRQVRNAAGKWLEEAYSGFKSRLPSQ